MKHILAAVLISACAYTLPVSAGPSSVAGPASVVDGDTVVVDGVTVRLKGVDASERGTVRGEAATRLMRELVTGDLNCSLRGEAHVGP